MKHINFRLFLVGSILASPLLAAAASFDCTKAGTEIEKSICTNEVLSKLDDELASSYRSAKASSVNPDKLLADQRIWIRGRNACKNDECLKNSYNLRIDQLRKADSSLNKPTANIESSPAEAHAAQAPTPVIEKPSTEAPAKTEPPAPPTIVKNSTPAPSTKTEVAPKENKNSSENNETNSGFSFISIFNGFLRIVAAGLFLYTFYASYKAIKNKGGWRIPAISLLAFMFVGSIGTKLTGVSSGVSSGSSIVGDWQCDQLVHNFKTDRAIKAREYLRFKSDGTWIDARNDSGKYNVKTGEISLVTKRSENIGSIVKLENDKLEFMVNHGNVNSAYYCQRKLKASNKAHQVETMFQVLQIKIRTISHRRDFLCNSTA